MAEQKQDAQDLGKAINAGSFNQVFIIRNKVNAFTYVLATNDDKILTTHNFVMSGLEGLRIEQSAKNGVYFIVSNANPNKVLACDDNGVIRITGNRQPDGWEGWKLEPAGDHIYFVVSNKKGFVLAIDDDGNVKTTKNKVKDGWEGLQILSYNKPMGIFLHSVKQNKQLAINDDKQITSTGNRVFNGWEGFNLEPSVIPNVYFLVHNKNVNWVLACDDNGKLHITGNRVPNGWEGWRIENNGNGSDGIKFIVHNSFVLAMDDDGKVLTTKNRVPDGWEGFRIEAVMLDNL